MWLSDFTFPHIHVVHTQEDSICGGFGTAGCWTGASAIIYCHYNQNQKKIIENKVMK